MLFREKGFYTTIEGLDSIIRSRFCGTGVCVGNPALKGSRAAVEVRLVLTSLVLTLSSDQPAVLHGGVLKVPGLLQLGSRGDAPAGQRPVCSLQSRG